MDCYEENISGQEPAEDNLQEVQQSEQEAACPAQEPEMTQILREEPQKESPFADSPYVNVIPQEPRRADRVYGTFNQPTKKKSTGKLKKRIVAAVLAVALVVGSCWATASIINNRWETETSQIYSQLNQKINDLQNQLNELTPGSTGQSVSGSQLVNPDGGLTPAQVYAQNKKSVVAISCTAIFTNGLVQQQGTSTGSGFVLSADGYVITNYHVVEGATQIEVITYDGQSYIAQLKGYDATNDLAVLKTEAKNLQPVKLGSSDKLIIGDMVVAIGNPLGELTSTQTVGYISGKDREVSTDGTVINMLQTDAAINPGNSGGPLFNMNGEVVGITTAKYSGTTASGASIEGIGFAIPIDDVTRMVSDIIEYGYVTGAYLGVSVMNMDAQTASIYRLPVGSYVDEVVEGASADRAGVCQGDIIIALGDYQVQSNSDLTRALRHFRPGDRTTITVFRSGTEVKLPITLDEKPQQTQEQPTQPTQPQEDSPDGNGGYFGWPFG